MVDKRKRRPAHLGVILKEDVLLEAEVNQGQPCPDVAVALLCSTPFGIIGIFTGFE